ncbi:MAG TPA: anti-virulence regulator CigR family protein [Pseudoxanthomonas sp.]|nr:anti-virulence regulator CigR family protein [Pseudoxanthomonas sp.]
MNASARRTAPVLRPVALALAACLLAPPAFAAPPEGKGRDKDRPSQPHAPARHDDGRGPERHDRDGRDARITVTLGLGDARRIALSHGYTGYAALPPGIRKNLARGKPLPPGIARKAVPAPMLRELPAYPGHEWRVAGSDLVLVALATGIVVEVLGGVFD